MLLVKNIKNIKYASQKIKMNQEYSSQKYGQCIHYAHGCSRRRQYVTGADAAGLLVYCATASGWGIMVGHQRA